ncbi:hypothetical protein MKK65_29580 [Methylobacterium sp. J-001]|uniref:hypothetical protein n=1 Tax=Methylobacterium sp. J-001 TaxID=2836609 RepID=UPI001FBA1D46|nr:hypothetical protein [Methylobacterium sp. J-001]MCJ2120660.1 hypothetical protein [Methylobacterium sp. J-001]
MADTPTDAQTLAMYNALAIAMQSKDPGDARSVGMPGWPAIGDLKTIDGHVMRWTGNTWSRADAVA